MENLFRQDSQSILLLLQRAFSKCTISHLALLLLSIHQVLMDTNCIISTTILPSLTALQEHISSISFRMALIKCTHRVALYVSDKPSVSCNNRLHLRPKVRRQFSACSGQGQHRETFTHQLKSYVVYILYIHNSE